MLNKIKQRDERRQTWMTKIMNLPSMEVEKHFLSLLLSLQTRLMLCEILDDCLENQIKWQETHRNFFITQMQRSREIHEVLKDIYAAIDNLKNENKNLSKI